MLVIKQERKRQRIPHVTLGPSDLRSGFRVAAVPMATGKLALPEAICLQASGPLQGAWVSLCTWGPRFQLPAVGKDPEACESWGGPQPMVSRSLRGGPGSAGEGLALPRTHCPPPQSSFPMALQPLALHTPLSTYHVPPPSLLPRGGELLGHWGAVCTSALLWLGGKANLGPSAEVRPPASLPAGLWRGLKTTRSQGILSSCCKSVC